MDIKSLMVGDWVYNKHHEKNIRLTQYDFFTNTHNDFGEQKLVPFAKPTSGRDLEPIPLSVEILKKNGFEKVQIHGEKQDDIFQCFDGEIIIEVGIYDPNFILIHYRYETPDGINSGELSSIVKVDGGKVYLHELQHALRLCGIHKEIEL